MKIVIDGDAKEIAALVLAVQERQLEKDIAGKVIALMPKQMNCAEKLKLKQEFKNQVNANFDDSIGGVKITYEKKGETV